jgi:hypothetical protein
VADGRRPVAEFFLYLLATDKDSRVCESLHDTPIGEHFSMGALRDEADFAS